MNETAKLDVKGKRTEPSWNLLTADLKTVIRKYKQPNTKKRTK